MNLTNKSPDSNTNKVNVSIKNTFPKISWYNLVSESGLGSIPKLELELTSIPIPIPELELELQAMELELESELVNGVDRNWNGIEASISIPPSILFTFPYFLLLMAHIDVMKIADVFFKERICFKISYYKKISVIEL